MRSISSVLFLVFALFANHIIALKVTPGSRCAVLCLDDPESDPNDPKSSTTTPDDIVCADDDYNTDLHGIKFQNCMECLQTSNATSGTESDNSWFIHNIRYSVDVCLYDFPESSSSKRISSPCDIGYACQPLKTALEAGITNSTSGTYDYCSADGGAFGGPNTDSCIQCLESSPNQAYLANFVTALKAGCEQKPAPGVLLGLSGTVFSNDLVNITATSSLSNQSTGGSSTFTTGAIAGIAIGAALLFLGGTGLFYVYYRRQKRLYAEANLPTYTPWTNGSGSMEPKIATSHHYELRAQAARTLDYSGKEIQPSQMSEGFNFNLNQPEIILPTHPAYIPRAHSRQPSMDSHMRPVKSNRPDSYAVQTYLNAAQGMNNTGGMKIPTPPPATFRGLAFQNPGIVCDLYNMHGSASQSRANSLDGRGASLDSQPLFYPNRPQNSQPIQYTPTAQPQQQPTFQNQQFNVPPPPRTAKVPYLSFPSLPKLRVPKKYTPPVITVQVATPTDGLGSINNNQAGAPGVEGESSRDTSFEACRKPPTPPVMTPPRVGSPSRS